MKVPFYVALAFLSSVACTDGLGTRARDADRTTQVPSTQPDGDQLCEPQSRDLSYGKTIPGLWLEEVIVRLGAPGEHPAPRSEIRDTGTALWIDIPAYRKGSIIYATMITPDTDPNFTSATDQMIERRGSYTLYFNKGAYAWESYKASNGNWQLSLLAYPGAGSDVVAWPQGIIAWLNNVVDRAEQSPPQCRGPIN
ncbi:MAG: hypothetical protein ACR2MC_10110 [Actinomycetota bacterium]